MIDGWNISSEIGCRWMPLHLTDDKSTLIQIMDWCRQTTSHYLNQCWPSFMSLYGVTRPNVVAIGAHHKNMAVLISIRFLRDVICARIYVKHVFCTSLYHVTKMGVPTNQYILARQGFYLYLDRSPTKFWICICKRFVLIPCNCHQWELHFNTGILASRQIQLSVYSIVIRCKNICAYIYIYYTNICRYAYIFERIYGCVISR